LVAFIFILSVVDSSDPELSLFAELMKESQFWKLYKEDPAACAIVMKTSVGLVYLLACLLEPFMPSFSNEV
jgi:methionyl-tRNA synthetase